METKEETIKRLEQEYSELYQEKYSKNEKVEHDVLTLKQGDWIWSEFFKEANKIKRIHKNHVDFYFKYENGLICGLLDFIENRTNIKTHRYATLTEIEERLTKEINNLKTSL